MRKMIFILVLVLSSMLCACTSNMMSREFGGEQTIYLEHGQKLMEVTWKGDNLWYLVEPMDSDYIPKTKTFKEDASFGMLNCSVTFIERK